MERTQKHFPVFVHVCCAHLQMHIGITGRPADTIIVTLGGSARLVPNSSAKP